jgi:hypothetical protein
LSSDDMSVVRTVSSFLRRNFRYSTFFGDTSSPVKDSMNPCMNRDYLTFLIWSQNRVYFLVLFLNGSNGKDSFR